MSQVETRPLALGLRAPPNLTKARLWDYLQLGFCTISPAFSRNILHENWWWSSNFHKIINFFESSIIIDDTWSLLGWSSFKNPRMTTDEKLKIGSTGLKFHLPYKEPSKPQTFRRFFWTNLERCPLKGSLWNRGAFRSKRFSSCMNSSHTFPRWFLWSLLSDWYFAYACGVTKSTMHLFHAF